MRYWYQVFRGKGLRASAAYVAAAIAVRTVSLGNRVHVADICYLFRGTTDAQHRDCLRLFAGHAKSTCGPTN